MKKFTIGLLIAVTICFSTSAQLINISFRHARLNATKKIDTFDVYAGAGTGYVSVSGPSTGPTSAPAVNANGSWTGITIRIDVDSATIPVGVVLDSGFVKPNYLTTTGGSFQNNVPGTLTPTYPINSSFSRDGGITFTNSANSAGDLGATPILLGSVYLYFSSAVSATSRITPRTNGYLIVSPNPGSFWTNIQSPATQRSFSLPGSTPLPITLLSFDAVKDGAFRSRIDWKTANEQNVSYFDVERSSNAVDFPIVISHMKAHGNSTTEQNYLAYDNIPMAGDNWYRLRTVDNDGTTSYSVPQKVIFGNKNNGAITVMPNPINENSLLSISTDQAQDVTYQVTDVGGKLISTGTFSLTAGVTTHRLDLKGLAAGTYYVNVHGASVEGSVKVIKAQ